MNHYFIDSTACIDKVDQIVVGIKIWHFSYLINDAVIGFMSSTSPSALT
jgi:hypothetical protein